MNKIPLNIVGLDGGGFIIKKGGGGGAPVSKPVNDVNFYDYDGTILHSYTKDEFLALSALPQLPERKGLICQEWNWELSEAQEYVAEYGLCDIGATYITDDGKTRLYITIAAEGRMGVPLYFSQTMTNGVTIDWGDGSAPQTLSGTGNKNTTHKYAAIGDYVISLDPAEGCTLGLGHNSTSYCMMGSVSNYSLKTYLRMLKKVEMGDNVTIGRYAFYNCACLSSVIIPNGVTSIGYSAFGNCACLSSMIIPNGVTSIAELAFKSCESLSSIIISNSITSIESSTFEDCVSLPSLVIPNSVTNIGSNAFIRCYGMAFYDFSSHTAVPSLANTNAFSDIPSDCKIIVPDVLYDEWKAATNWSSSSIVNKIIKKSDWDASQS